MSSEKDNPSSISDDVKNSLSNAKNSLSTEIDNAINTPKDTTTEEKISHNAKMILLALFTLVGFIVLLGTVVIYQQVDISVEVITIIFSTSITGCFTLGGVLINAIWGK